MLDLTALFPAISINFEPNDTITIYNHYSDESPVPLML
jgi:hypothetical protein